MKVSLEATIRATEIVCRTVYVLLILVVIYDLSSLAGIVDPLLGSDNRPFAYIGIGMAGFFLAVLAVTVHINSSIIPLGWSVRRVILAPLDRDERIVLESYEVSGWFDDDLTYNHRFLKLMLTSKRLVVRFLFSLPRFALSEIPIADICGVSLAKGTRLWHPNEVVRIEFNDHGHHRTFSFSHEEQSAWLSALSELRAETEDKHDKVQVPTEYT